MDQWTIHYTVLYRTDATGHWIIDSYRPGYYWIYGKTNSISPVGGWGDPFGWTFQVNNVWRSGNDISWAITGKGWWSVAHYVWWLEDGAWRGPGYVRGEHHDRTAPGGGGGGPVNLGTTYDFCYIE